MAENEAVVRVQVAGSKAKREDDDAGDEATRTTLSRAPIFADAGSEADEIDSIIVERIGPIREGTLEPRAEPTLSEDDLRERWGGGRFKLTGRTEKGKPVKGAYRTLEIAGAPILQSELARRRYAQMIGAAGGDASAPTAQAITMADVAALLEKSGEKEERERLRREEDDRRRRDEEDARHRRDLERIAAETKAQADARAAEDQRRREEDERREERRRRDDEQRDERRRKDEEESRRRDREHQTAMAALAAKPAPDPVAMLLAGVNLAGKMAGAGGGGEAGPVDPLTALAANLPATVQELGKMFGAKPNAAGAGGAEPLTIAGPLGEKGKRAVQHLQNQGFSAEQALEHVFDTFMQAKRPNAPPEPARTAAPPSVPPPPPRRGAPPAPRPSAPPEPPPEPSNGTAIPG